MEVRPVEQGFTELNIRQESGTPHFIRLHDGVVRLLEGALARSSRGILLGTVESGEKCTIDVRDAEPVIEQDWRALEIAMRRWRRDAQVVGYYRTRGRTDFSPSDADLAAFQKHFGEKDQLFLSIAAPKDGVSGAVFFLGEEGELRPQRTTVEFPFSLRALAGEEAAPAQLPEPVASRAAVASEPGSGRLWMIAAGGVLVVGSVFGFRNFDRLTGRQIEPVKLSQPAAPAAPLADMPNATLVLPQAEAAPAAESDPVTEDAAPAAPVFVRNPDVVAQPMRQFIPLVPEELKAKLPAEIVVRVRADIDASGHVIQAVSLSHGDSIAEALGQAAAEAVRKWRFEPARKGRRKVASQLVLTFPFHGAPLSALSGSE